MPDREARGRAVYDHDKRSRARPGGVAVRWPTGAWARSSSTVCRGAGSSAARTATIPRGDADDGRRTIVIETGDEEPRTSRAVADEEFASRDEALRARERHDELWAGDEPFADATRREPREPRSLGRADAWAPSRHPSTRGARSEARADASSAAVKPAGAP